MFRILAQTEQDVDDQLTATRARFQTRSSKYSRVTLQAFGAFGMDHETPSTHETPRRFVRALGPRHRGLLR